MPDEYDAFPDDANEWRDTDGNEVGDNADTDDEADGMPDEWESQYGLNPLFDDARYDADRDGVSNLDEFENGTNPMNHPPSAPVLSFPGEEETVTSLTPELSVGEYEDPDDNYPLASIHWQISDNPEFTDPIADEIREDGFRSFTIPESRLTAESIYYWRVRFTDNQHESSDWSPIRLFKTPKVFHFDFAQGYDGWSGGFAEYPAGSEEFYELIWQRKILPDELRQEDESDNPQFGLYVSGLNHSDDLFMYIKKRLEGLSPNTRYHIIFKVKFGTNAPVGCMGVGGAPDSVYMKAGAIGIEPRSGTCACPLDGNYFMIPSGHYFMNIDKGNQSIGGTQALLIGNIGNGISDCSSKAYNYKILDNQSNPLEITTNHNGFLWLMIGTDSGFEATTSLYYTNIEIRLIEKGNIQVK
ncbi:MAG: hypothetical protein R2941_21280 [Desulfobacterales bacterium]